MQQELDQMLAPIALYPDALLSQILMASTYPLEVVEAARWSRANPNLKGDQAVQAVAQNAWDPSVKSLVAFPQILLMMDDNLNWTERLGDAFLAQQAQVMDTVQNLRQKAYAAGNLKSSDQVRVEQQGQTIVVAPAAPEVVYVPYYDPWVVYGPWWWPAYPPIYWAPWPGYVRGYYPGYWWGAPIGLSVGFFFGGFDWHRRYAYVNRVDNYYVRPTWVNRYSSYSTGRWQRNYWQRSGTSGTYARYSDPVNRQQFQSTSPLRDSRREERRSLAQPRTQVAPQQIAPRQQSFAPRFDTAPRLDTRQGFQGTPERRRDFDRVERAQRQAQPQPRQQAEPRRFEPRQQAMPSAPVAAPRLERREPRIEQRTQRFEQRSERRAERNESHGGGRRFN